MITRIIYFKYQKLAQIRSLCPLSSQIISIYLCNHFWKPFTWVDCRGAEVSLNLTELCQMSTTNEADMLLTSHVLIFSQDFFFIWFPGPVNSGPVPFLLPLYWFWIIIGLDLGMTIYIKTRSERSEILELVRISRWQLVDNWLIICWQLDANGLTIGKRLADNWLTIGWQLVDNWLTIGWQWTIWVLDLGFRTWTWAWQKYLFFKKCLVHKKYLLIGKPSKKVYHLLYWFWYI